MAYKTSVSYIFNSAGILFNRYAKDTEIILVAGKQEIFSVFVKKRRSTLIAKYQSIMECRVKVGRMSGKIHDKHLEFNFCKFNFAENENYYDTAGGG